MLFADRYSGQNTGTKTGPLLQYDLFDTLNTRELNCFFRQVETVSALNSKLRIMIF